MNRLFEKLKRQLFYLSLIRYKKNESVLRWGIVGVGYMGSEFGFTICSSRTSVISAVAGRRRERILKFSRRFKVKRTFNTYQEMINSNSGLFDILYVATPVETHYEIVKYALENSVPVVCEKPITSRVGELNEILLISKERKVFLMEAMWMRMLPTFSKAKELIASGTIGDVQQLIVNFNKMNHYEGLAESPQRIDYEGVLLDYGNYCIAFAQAFMPGSSIKIESAHSRRNQGVDFDWSLILVSEDVKSFINISSSFDAESKAVVIGSKGRIQWDSQFNRTNTITLHDKSGNRKKEYKFNYRNGGFEYQLKEVEKCVTKGSQQSDIVPLADSLKRMELITRLNLDDRDINTTVE